MAGTIVADTISDGAGNTTAMDNAIYGSAKAWVNFNASSGTSCTISASYNVSSVTYNSTTNYNVNFTNAFVDANYTVLYTSDTNQIASIYSSSQAPTSSSVRVTLGGSTNPARNYVAIFR
jgi:hypothetical protein